MKTNITKIILLLALLVCFDSYNANAVIYDIIPPGNLASSFTRWQAPLNNMLNIYDMQNLLTKDFLASKGMAASYINSIAVKCTTSMASTAQNSRYQNDITIWMANVDWTQMRPDFFVQGLPDDPGLEEVYNRADWSWSQVKLEDPNYLTQVAYTSGQWATFVLDKPFFYTGGAILIKICSTPSPKSYNGWEDEIQIAGVSSQNNVLAYTGYHNGWGTYNFYCGAKHEVGSGSNQITLNRNSNLLYYRFDVTNPPFLSNYAPADGSELTTSKTETSSIVAPSIDLIRFPANPIMEAQYVIRNSRGNIVWRAVNPTDPNNEWVPIDANLVSDASGSPVTCFFNRAVGPLADVSNPARAQISFKGEALDGEYTIEIHTRFENPDEPGTYIYDERNASFIVRQENNITLTSINQPIANQMYRISSDPVPIEVVFSNTGLQLLPSYSIYYSVSRVISTTVGGNAVLSYTPVWDTLCYETNQPLPAGGARPHQLLSSFIPSSILGLDAGDYVLDVRVYTGSDSLSGLGNSLRQPFRLNYAYDGSVDAVIYPSSSSQLYTHQAYYPQIRISNRAAMPINSVELSIICQPVGSTNIVYQSRETVLGLPAWEEYLDDGGNLVPYDNVFRDVAFSSPMILQEAGSYRLTISIDSSEDRNLLNNSLSYVFTIQPSLSGSYTVGNSLDYEDLHLAFTDIYNKGMDDTVRFVLGGGRHRLGSPTSAYGLELTSSLGGVDSSHPGTIRIEPASSVTTRGGVILEFSSASGVGLYVASSTESPYSNAPVNQFVGNSTAPVGERKKDYDRFNARLVIDGGPNKSLHIRMLGGLGRAVGSGNNVPILLGRGVQNVIIRNCIIETDAVAGAKVPGVLYDTRFNSFTFKDLESVSAGILIRNELPVDKFGRNDFGIDTVLNSNILIEDCEFIGGSYGVISTGIGPLYEHPTSSYVGYYNMNNVIRDNVFVGQEVAGVFMGYEQGSLVEGNVISGVRSSSYAGDVGGIILGGMGDPSLVSSGGTTGYNNFNITLNGNDINGVSSLLGSAYGIKVEQTLNDFTCSHLIGNKYFTNHNDSINIYNNSIWDIDSPFGVYGIRLFGSRDTLGRSDKFDRFTARLSSRLNLSHSRISNNTVYLEPSSLTSDTYFGGIVLQDVDTLEFYNNAISVSALSSELPSIFAPLVLQSVLPSSSVVSFSMDNNVYHSTPDNDNIVHFIEQDELDPSALLSDGFSVLYRGIAQWRRLSGAEDLSSLSDFSSILLPEILSVSSTASLPGYSYSRLVMGPSSALVSGLSLNNRGRRLPYISTDITGRTRGYATQLYDIGAWEFDAPQYDDDCEVLGFVSPLALRSVVPPYDDAEYIMSPSSISVSVRLRNNGTSSVQRRPVRLLVEYKHPLTGSYVRVAELTSTFNLSTGETVLVDFTDAISALSGSSVFPLSYTDLGLRLGLSESRFYVMQNNVTPIYRYTAIVSYDGDRVSSNDIISKEVRYYLKKSKYSAILSVENTTFIPSSSESDYVGWLESHREDLISANGLQSVLDSVSSYLNYRSLVAGFSSLGFHRDSLDYDLFDRNAWEPSSVNYSNYRYMFWSDGHDSRLSSNQINDLRIFIQDGRALRKGIVMASEELARYTASQFAARRSDIIKTIFGTNIRGLGVYDASPANTLRLTGNALAPKLSLFLTQTSLYTDHNLDNGYSPAIFESYGSNSSLSSLQALYYADPADQSSMDKTFGLVSYSPYQHCIYLGADWRNFSDVSLLLESILSSMGGLLSDDAALPLDLLSFDASALNGSVSLNWSTSGSSTSREYVVEKLVGSAFAPIYHTLANSTAYHTVDDAVSAGNTYTYRLRMLLYDGSVSYSSERSVSLLGTDLVVSLGVPTPIPASHSLTVNYSLSLPGVVGLTLYDLSGASVLSLRTGGVLAAGSYTESYSVADLPSGTYNLVLECGGVVKLQRVVISR